MTRFSLLRLPDLRLAGLIVLVTAALSGPVLAQSAQCQSWQAELSSLGRNSGGGDRQAASQARRVGNELSRTINQYRAMGCEGQSNVFYDNSPPQCGAIGQRIGELQGSFASLQQRAQSGGGSSNAGRRAQLQAAIEANCRPGVYETRPEPPRPRGFFEALFGLPERQPDRAPGMPELDGQKPDVAVEDEKPKTATWGSGRAVCVRACDGFFFPLATRNGDTDDEMCQALCPATATSAYYLGGAGDIENAVNSDGASYSSQPNALRYTRSFDAACTCRKPGTSWSAALADAEKMLEKRRGDVIVSEKRAEELSKPREARKATAKNAAEEATASTSANEPASGGQSQTRKLTGADGETRDVRIVAPALTPQSGDNRPIAQAVPRR